MATQTLTKFECASCKSELAVKLHIIEGNRYSDTHSVLCEVTPCPVCNANIDSILSHVTNLKSSLESIKQTSFSKPDAKENHNA